MTEASENDYLVRVRAQVMCRDEGTGGWMALGGGGLADVMVCRRGPGSGDINGDQSQTQTSTSVSHTEYYIHGRRISDNTLVLDCTVKDDFQYHKVMPTFHHWVSDEKKFGLTFQTAADARAFDKGVRIAVNDLYRLGGAWPTMYGFEEKNSEAKPKEDDEENIFEPIYFEVLPVPESRSSSEKSSASRRQELSQTPILSAITLPHHAHHPLSESLNLPYDDKLDDSDTDRCPYVHLSAVHEYTYPQVGPGGVISSEKSSPNTKPPLLKRDSGSLKKCGYSGAPPLPKKHTETFQARVKCRYCQEWYLESANRRGACKFAPDCFRSCIDCVSCIKCAQCMLYHCMSDSEGDFAMHPCTCGPPTENCAKRWVGITLLSLLVPCLWCYMPLKCIHRTAKAFNLTGGVHAPQPK
ncbi:sprouty-related, EVH1 domain-containing protein 1 [Vanessa atalanta]|uniref:sprouty-related, EVH1 domain-containing protein 1 n=1 Tax=Vanessa atalanta TaxID=42275 RepID=UPI001FCCC1B6|nr:sprouty-related, EVH1 domain-containing protein 1 [Vanessa atalanta]